MRKKCIIVAEFPAPYRVSVFKEFSKSFDIIVFYVQSNEKTRSPLYSVNSELFEHYFLDTKEGKKKFRFYLKNIKLFDFAFAYNFSVLPGIKLAFKAYYNKIPLFYNADGGFINHHPIKDLIKKSLVKKCDIYFSSGKAADKYFLEYGGCASKIIHHRFTSLTKADHISYDITLDKSVYKNLLGLDKTKSYMISVGQFIPRKGFDLLLKCWKELEPKDWELLIIGGGYQKEEYMDFIKNNKIDNVRILEYVDKKKLEKYYLASSIFVLLTREDVWGLVINEAMNFGLPVITTNKCVAGNELIDDFKEGFITDINDITNIKEKMQLLMTSPGLREIMSKSCISKILDESLENIADVQINAINKFLDESR